MKTARCLPTLLFIGAGLMARTDAATGESAPGFTKLLPLPAPKVSGFAEAYPGGSYEAANLVDGDPRTEYSSKGKGKETFIEFDFGSPVAVRGFRHLDRNDPATVAASELVFKDAGGRAVATVPIAHANRRAGVTFIALPAAIEARKVLWRVTGLGPQGHGTVGGAEIAFFTAARPEPAPSGISLDVKPFPVLKRRGNEALRPLRISLDDPYVEPFQAVVRVEGLGPETLDLALGARALDLSLPAAGPGKTIAVSVEAAGQTVAQREVEIEPVREKVIYILPHSHVDIGYTELQGDVEKKQMRNIARGIELARATAGNPEGSRYKWNVEVLWAVESYLRGSPLAAQEEFIDAVRKGWVGLDAMYGNELTGLCRDEELLRLFRYATELGKRCGVPVVSAMISDVPGYTWGTVQAMAHAGVRYFSIAPNYFDRIGTTLEAWENRPFWWVSAGGGEKVLCWVPYYGYALSHVIGELSEPFLLDLAARLQAPAYPYEIAYLRWSGHGDNAVPDEKLPESVKEWNEKYAWPRLVIATTAEAFRAFEAKHGRELPEARGDWTPYWEDGAGSSARETAMNRASAERLVQAEALWAIREPGKFLPDAFHEAWRNVLLYSEHTWGAHNSISQPDLPFVKEQWKVKGGFALQADAGSRELLKDALARTAPGAVPGSAMDVYNTDSWIRSDLVQVPAELSKAGSTVRDEEGRPVSAQLLKSGRLAVLARDVPPFGARRYSISTGEPQAEGQARAAGASLTNGIVSVRIDEKTGSIVELAAKGLEGNLADAGAGGLNEYLYLIGADASKVRRSGPVKVTAGETGPLVASLVIESEAPGCRKLTREIRVIDGMDRVEIIDRIDKLAVREKEGVHFGFAFNVQRGALRLGVPWAVMRPELDQIPGSCKNWFVVERWADVSNDSLGVTWATVDAPLVEVGGITANLIGSQKNPKAWLAHVEPSQKILSWVMNNHWHTNYRADQEGPTVFRYALRPHGAYDPVQAAEFGVATNRPLIAGPAAGNAPPRPRLRLEGDGVIATAFKPADEGNARILRLFGASGKEGRAALLWADPQPKSVWISDTSEKALRRLEGAVTVPAWGIVTVRAEMP